MTPLALVQRELQVLEQAQVPEREQRQERAAQLAQELVRRAQQEPRGIAGTGAGAGAGT